MLNRNSDTSWWARAALFFAFSVPIGSFASAATTITTFSPQGEVAQVRQVRATFSESMVPFGDLRQPDPFTVQCSEAGTGRWADDKSWAFDFKRDLPPGTRCTMIMKPGLKSVAGNAVSGKTTFNFNTGGPAIVRSYPSSGRIEEGQYFALLLNGAADAASVERFAYCTAGGISERIGVSLVTGAERDAILKTLRLSAMADRTVTLRCKQTLPHGADMTLVWARGIATPTGVANSADRHLPFKVQDDFTASFTCERENAHADCLPIRPLRVEFSAPISREQAERIVLSAPDGKHKATFEHNRGEEAEGLFSFVQRGYRKTLLFFGRTAGTADADPSASGVTAVEFPPSFPEAAAITIEIPADLHDESNRPLSNAGLFPIRTKTAVAPPIVKFAAAPFGILELNAQPLLPVTVRSVEADLKVSAKTVAPSSPGTIRELRLTDDAQIIHWLARTTRYHESSLLKTSVTAELGIPFAAPRSQLKGRPAVRYGQIDDDEDPASNKYVETRTLSLLNREPGTAKVALPVPAAGDPRPFEVVGIPRCHSPVFTSRRNRIRKNSARRSSKAARCSCARPPWSPISGCISSSGRPNAGVWVTTLDHGKPVSGATVQVSDCTGTALWSGKTDASGFARVDKALPRQLGNLCGEEGAEDGYFVSARKTDEMQRDDMAFTWSTWTQGIEPWRYALNAHEGSTGGVIAHTVLDRRLFRAGETVSMKHYIREATLKSLAVMPTAQIARHAHHYPSGVRPDVRDPSHMAQ